MALKLVERLGARTQDVSESMRSYVDSFDNRVTTKANEVTTGLDQRLANFEQALDSRRKRSLKPCPAGSWTSPRR